MLFPLVFYQSRLSIKPGLFFYEKKFLLLIFYLSSPSTPLNLFSTYFFISPSACKSFLSLEMISGSASQTHSEAKIYTYISLVLRSIFRCHFISQLPVIISIFIQMGIVDGPSLIKKRGISYFISMFFSSPICPPDLLSQFPTLFPIPFSSESSISIALSLGGGAWLPPFGRMKHAQKI